jgi:GT2 family glycosyltransferase/SAM-dependent methyltransferase
MSLHRRAGAPRLIEWTGERCVPWAPDVQVVYEHFHRYMWAARVVEGRRVLDLGSGEGFGAAILAESAAHVVGVDVDERTVEHSKLNYGGSKLEFQVGTALDLSGFEDGSFGAVVAFEIIEHVQDQERVLEEVARLLGDEGVLVVSTPDRRLYSEATGQHNPFHERELTLEELQELLALHFPHVAGYGQRTITGSHLHALEGPQRDAPTSDQPDFYIERAGEEWREAGDPAALYIVALASKAPLPEMADTSTLADCGIELVRARELDTAHALEERDAAVRAKDEWSALVERERAAHAQEQVERAHEQVARARELREREVQYNEELKQREQDIMVGRERIVELRAELASRNAELSSREAEVAAARSLNRRTEESVTWQAFQRARGRLYGAIGERSLLARTLNLSLRLAGRVLIKRPKPPIEAPGSQGEGAGAAPSVPTISLPEYENPKVSLIIPVYAHADLTQACLESIRDNTTQVSYEVILVEDAADEATKRLLEGVRGARIVHNESNLGYIRSVKRGASFARGRWLVLFNNDTEVRPGWLTAMLDCAESAEDIGVVTPKFLYPDGSLNEAGGIIWRDGTGVNYGRGDRPEHFQYEYRRETDYGSAAALMVSADLWKAMGGYDERYVPMYYEDTDLCFEARERGLRVMYEPKAVVVHIEGATAGNDVESGFKRYQEQNRVKFLAKWRHRLESEQMRPAPTNLRLAANRHRGPHVLVIDFRVPTWNHDSGSLRMLNIVQALIGLGARVTLMPDNFAPLQPYTGALQRMGVEVLYGALDVNAELATIGPKLSGVILSRPHVASRWLDTLREFAPSAIVAYDTVDLHWLRETRRSGSESPASGAPSTNGSGHPIIGPKAEALRQLELAMIRATDRTLVVSASEQAQVEKDVPGAKVLVVPNVHEIEPLVAPPQDRSGILFVGGFEHPPNAGAALRLVKDVMPAVWRELGDVKVMIVGPNPPPEVQALAAPLVEVTGWIEDLRPLLEQARLMVAPLRYGAGLKGKVTQALAVGLPVVTTPVGAEGIDHPEECLLVAESSQELAAHVVRAYRDDELWRSLSRAGQAFIAAQCSTAIVTDRLGQLFEGALVSAPGGGPASPQARPTLS